MLQFLAHGNVCFTTFFKGSRKTFFWETRNLISATFLKGLLGPEINPFLGLRNARFPNVFKGFLVDTLHIVFGKQEMLVFTRFVKGFWTFYFLPDF